MSVLKPTFVKTLHELAAYVYFPIPRGRIWPALDHLRRIGIAVVPSVMEMGARTLIFNATGSTIRWGSIKVLK